jgi:hypothetical protein
MICRGHIKAACVAWSFMAAVCAAGRAETVSGDINSANSASCDQRISELEAELAALKRGAGDVFFASSPVGGCVQQDACSNCDPGDCQCLRFCTGAALVFAKPHYKEAFQVSEISLPNLQQELLPFLYDYSPSTRVWLGCTTPTGLGVRADYWQFDQAGDRRTLTSDGLTWYGAHATTIIFPATVIADAAGETLTVDDGLEVHVANLLGTLDTEFAGISLVGGGGLRYASLKQGFSAVVSDGGGPPVGLLRWSRDFEGLGPAIAVSARRPIGCCGLSLIAEGGGALLFGIKRLNRFVSGNVGAATMPHLMLDDANEVVPIIDLRMGGEWSYRFANDWLVAVQGLYEGQLWAEAGAPTLGFLGLEGFALQCELRH